MTGLSDTICAIATPPGKGGISVIRISGPLAAACAERLLGFLPAPRHAHYGPFRDAAGDVIDTGITLYFPGPDSFTGEDVVELQSHGGPFVVDLLLQDLLDHGLRLARPGEFSERAFLNDKIDLTQAEAIADLIDSSSRSAARFAVRSLQGEFSRLIDDLADAMIELRKYVEAAMDFPDEDVDFLASGEVQSRLSGLLARLDRILAQATQGTIMQEGLNVVIAGEPNAGKSSLLNVLAGQSRAIVTEIAGTTRDTLREHISIDGMPLHVIDTAGLHASEDLVEQEGIRRAWQAIRDADLVLLVVDATRGMDRETSPLWRELNDAIDEPGKLMLVVNKTDLSGHPPGSAPFGPEDLPAIHLSAKTGAGIEDLKGAIRDFAGLNTSLEGGFIARRRHLDALNRSRRHLESALAQLTGSQSGELVAEDLREAHLALESITGRFSADDLLGAIFSSFCIGK